jgi:thioredoxin-dependent peroxiredoxin
MASKKVSKKKGSSRAKASAKKAPVKKASAKATKAVAKKTPAKAKKSPAKKAVAKVAKVSAKKAVAKATKAVKKAVAKATKAVKKAVANATKPSGKKSPAKAASVDAKSSSVAIGLDVGAQAPAFTLQDQSGVVLSSADLRGKPYVLYFYPKDDTPGCTREACDFRDEYGAFQQAGITVLGVSPDSSKSHAGFAAKYSLPFRLLADPDKVLSTAYGVYGPKQNYGREYMGIIRSTFVVGADGRVLAAYRGVKVDGHVQKVLARALEGAA